VSDSFGWYNEKMLLKNGAPDSPLGEDLKKKALRETVTVCLVRHGETEANTQEILADGTMDSPLTEKGKLDAQEMGSALAADGCFFSYAYASGLGRTQQTASLILEAEEANAPENAGMQENAGTSETFGTAEKADGSSGEIRAGEIRVKEGLNDIFWGKAAGRKAEDVKHEYGENVIAEYMAASPGDGYVSPLGAEDKLAFVERFDKAMTEAAEESLAAWRQAAPEADRGPRILVVAHSSAAFWLSRKFPQAGNLQLDNVSATVLEYRNGKWKLRDFNDRNYDELAGKITKNME
jgi:broad specificity phosphatase PhoE